MLYDGFTRHCGHLKCIFYNQPGQLPLCCSYWLAVGSINPLGPITDFGWICHDGILQPHSTLGFKEWDIALCRFLVWFYLFIFFVMYCNCDWRFHKSKTMSKDNECGTKWPIYWKWCASLQSTPVLVYIGTYCTVFILSWVNSPKTGDFNFLPLLNLFSSCCKLSNEREGIFSFTFLVFQIIWRWLFFFTYECLWKVNETKFTD